MPASCKERGDRPITDIVVDVSYPTSLSVSIIIVATDELHHLRGCLQSVSSLDGPVPEVIVVDNASTDGTAPVLASEFPWVNLIRSPRRLGYAPANNLGFQYAEGDYLIVLNPDTQVGPAFVKGLVAVSQQHGDRALVTSRICMFDDPDIINSCGNEVNFGLISACRGIGELAKSHSVEAEVASISGCAFLIPRKVLLHIGPFREAIYPYLEDTELSLRAWLCGYRCITAPESVVFHKYALRLRSDKFYYLERNRWLVMLQVYKLRTLALLMPALMLIEMLTWTFAATQGRQYVVAKARSYIGVVRMFRIVRSDRAQTQELRYSTDRELLLQLSGRLPIGQLTNNLIARAIIHLVNSLFTIYLHGVCHIIRW